MAERYPDLLGGKGGRAAAIWLAAAAIALYILGLVLLEISPVRIWTGLSQLGTIIVLMLPPSTGGHFDLYLQALGQTLSIAFLGTLLAAILAIPFGFLAARNVVANRVMHVLARRSLDTMRSIDVLIWALIWINVVGLGPFAGALAIASSDSGALAKLMSESIETADRKPVDGVLASGGGRWPAIRFGIVPRSSRSSPASSSTSSSPTPAPPPSSASSAPAASASTSTSRSAFSNGARSPSSS